MNSLTSKLSGVLVVFVYILLLVGATVRVMGAGMACPDWPTCNGEWIPPFDPLVFAEWFHRLLVLVVSVLIVLQATIVASSKDLRARVGGLTLVAVFLLILQAALGAITVFENNSPISVTVHLVIAALFFATLIWTRCTLTQPLQVVQDGKTFPLFRSHVLMSLSLVFIQIGIGGMVSSSHAGLVCPDFPMCNGDWFPSMTGLVGLQMTHRYMAYAVALLVVGTFFMARRAGLTPRNKRLTRGCLIVVITQLLIGIGLIHAKLALPMSVAHLGLAMLLFGLLTGLAYGTRRT